MARRNVDEPGATPFAPTSQGAAANSSPATADHELGSQSIIEDETAPTPIDPGWIKGFAKAIVGAIGEDPTVVVNQSRGLFVENLPDAISAKARSITKQAISCCKSEIDRSDCLELIAGIAGVEAWELSP